VVNGTPVSYDALRMDNDAAKVVNTQPFPDLGLGRDRDASGDFYETLDTEPEWLGWNAAFVEPPKDTVDQEGVKALGKQAPHQGAKSWLLLLKACDIGSNSLPQRSGFFLHHFPTSSLRMNSYCTVIAAELLEESLTSPISLLTTLYTSIVFSIP
jgi:hypothetical protein